MNVNQSTAIRAGMFGAIAGLVVAVLSRIPFLGCLISPLAWIVFVAAGVLYVYFTATSTVIVPPAEGAAGGAIAGAIAGVVEAVVRSLLGLLFGTMAAASNLLSGAGARGAVAGVGFGIIGAIVSIVGGLVVGAVLGAIGGLVYAAIKGQSTATRP